MRPGVSEESAQKELDAAARLATPWSTIGHAVNTTIAFVAFHSSVPLAPLAFWALASYAVAGFVFYRWARRFDRKRRGPSPRPASTAAAQRRRAILFGAMLASLTMVYDKESGVMRMLIIAPFAHHWIVVAKTIAAALAGLIQAALLLALLAALGFLGAGINYPLLLAAVLITSLSCAALGVLVAAFTRTLDNFAAIMNFVIFPVFFLSGALYPVANLPLALKMTAMLNPFTYCVDLLKHAMLPPFSASSSELHAGLDALLSIGFTLLALIVASWRFSREQVYAPLIRVLAGKRE